MSHLQHEYYRGPRRGHLSIDEELCSAELAAIERGKVEANGNGSQSQRVVCWCAEGLINGKRLPIHRPEDCEYVAARSALVPDAVRRANDIVGERAGRWGKCGRWNTVFVSAMNELAAPLLNGATDHADG
jgi:hypothetical protein